MKRRDFIQTAVAIAATVPAINAKSGDDKPKSLVWPDSSEIKMANTWAKWGTVTPTFDTALTRRYDQ